MARQSSDSATPPRTEPSEATRRTMRANRRRDTAPELNIRRLLFAQGMRYRVDYPLPFDRRRRADIVFTRPRIAIFIDGCFWHGCPAHYVAPRTNTEFWSSKLRENRTRDRDTDERLGETGWYVLRFWEHEDPEAVATRIRAASESILDEDDPR